MFPQKAHRERERETVTCIAHRHRRLAVRRALKRQREGIAEVRRLGARESGNLNIRGDVSTWP